MNTHDYLMEGYKAQEEAYFQAQREALAWLFPVRTIERYGDSHNGA